jgi:peptidoglycan/xylan/chitin deacetylase (PgdA/CDA1 family)
MSRDPELIVVAYHYVRDLPRTRFPKIKALMLDTFRDQVTSLVTRYEMASLEAALAFLRGRYRPTTDLCLLTFDDGLKEHYTDVLPILMRHRVQGLFFPATACLEGRVASVHKIHFLMAALEFTDYRRAFLARLEKVRPGTLIEVAAEDVARAYPWDASEVGALKYLANYGVPPALRDHVIDDLFASYFGDDSSFAKDLYLSWNELREMQTYGMLVGGHSHAHLPLSNLSRHEQETDLARCFSILQQHLKPQAVWPFAYPYGRYDESTIQILRELSVACAFTVQAGVNDAGQERFELRRFDTNDLFKRDRTVTASAAPPAGYPADYTR